MLLNQKSIIRALTFWRRKQDGGSIFLLFPSVTCAEHIAKILVLWRGHISQLKDAPNLAKLVAINLPHWNESRSSVHRFTFYQSDIFKANRIAFSRTSSAGQSNGAAYAAGRVASSAREVGRPLYGEVGKFKDTTGRLKQHSPLPFLLELSAFARGPASKISRAPSFRCATKENIMKKGQV
jgi:hypothetical protein